ncbi:MAG: phosphoglycerate kinase [Parcubacteria group bacterium]|jgi:phosphoglycerate kinase
MDIKKIQAADVEGKKVLLRVDFNSAVSEDTVKEKFKIQAADETVRYLLALNAKVALITHLGRPEGKPDQKFSLNPIKDDVEYILSHKVKFVPDCVGEKVMETMNGLQEGEIAFLENVRFYPGDESNDEEFAKKLASGFDVFVNDAFSVCHRNQASVTGVAKILPSYAGFWLQKEIEEMEKIKSNPEKPAVAVIGGAKIETKLPMIKFFEGIYDNVLVGGKVANEALEQKIQFSEKVLLPNDFIDDRMDIGTETLVKFKEIIEKAKTIVWNGPTGKFEEEKYATSTNEILKSVLASSAYVLIGGGETLEVLEKNNAMGEIQKRGFVSTGGGAMLDYLGGQPMPGIDALRSN